MPKNRSGTPIPLRNETDQMGMNAAKYVQSKPVPPEEYISGFAKREMGRPGKAVSLAAPVPSTLAYRMLPFTDSELKYTKEPPPASMFDKMKAIELVSLLLDNTDDVELRRSYDEIHRYLLKIELVKSQRPLTSQENEVEEKIKAELVARALDSLAGPLGPRLAFMAGKNIPSLNAARPGDLPLPTAEVPP